MTYIFGIESTCDDTCAAVVRDGVEVLSNVVSSQDELHERFRGVVPEIASRAHLERIVPVMERALEVSGLSLEEMDAVAVSNRPGLIGGLLVGLTTAKALSLLLELPLLAVDHVRAHVYAGMMAAPDWEPPAAALTASGGHTFLCLVRGPLDMRFLGRTIDDAGGEAFDKGANILGLRGGGPALDRLAREGNPRAFRFPRPMKDEGYDFSFSGLKTALLYKVYGPGSRMPAGGSPPPDAPLADLAASYQEAICDVFVLKTMRAAEEFGARTVFVTGGVAANSRLREKTAERCAEAGVRAVFPPLSLCTDNAAMIAGLAMHHYLAGDFAPLDVQADARGEDER